MTETNSSPKGMDSQKLFTRLPWTLIFAFVFLAAAIIVAGSYYYSFTARSIKVEKYNDLSAVADLKVSAITQWRRECINDGVMIQNEVVARQLQNYLTRGRHKSEIVKWFETFTAHNKYSGALLLDREGTIRLSVGIYGDTIGINERALVRNAEQRREIILSDLRMSRALHTATFDVLIPVIRTGEGSGSLIGVLVLRIDPQQVFYPLLQSQSVPSRTSETVLVRREGDDILLLSELRFRKESAFKFRLPLSMVDLPASKAIRGVEGTVEGIDYRGIAVLAAVRKIPGTPWFLIAKIDQDEVYSLLHEEAWFIGVLVVGMLVTAASVIGFWWRHQRALFYRKLYEDELERKALVSHFDSASKYANDIIFLTDEKGRIVEANEQACRKYGYAYEEMLRLNIRDLRPLPLRKEILDRIKQMEAEGGALYETRHLRKDGTTFPVEVSARLIAVEGEKFYQAIIRDVSERKQAEESLVRLHQAVDTSGEAIFMTNREGIFTFINESFTRMYGYLPEEVIGKVTPRILKGGELKAGDYKAFWQTILSKQQVEWEISNRARDGRFLTVEASVSPVLDEEGNITGFLAIERDVSSRKRDEEKIRNLSRVYEMLSNVNQAIVRTRSREQLFDKICHIAVEDGKFILAWIGLLNEAAHKVNVTTYAGNSNGYLEELQIIADDSPHGKGPTATAYREGKHVVCNDIEHDELMAPWRESALARGYRSLASFPFLVFGKPGGNINFYASSAGFFTEKEIALLDELVADVAFALESLQLEEDRKKSDREIIEAHKFTKTILANSPVGILTYKATGECVTANETAAQMVGGTVEQLQALNFRTLQSWKNSGLLDVAERALGDGIPKRLDVFLVSTFGKEGWYAIRLAPFMSGKERHLLIVLTDISQRKEIEDQLRSSEQYYRQLINILPDGVVIIDENAVVQFVSPKMYEIFNIPIGINIVGMSLLQWVAPEERTAVRENIRTIVQTKKALRPIEYKLLRHDGAQFWGEFMSSAHLDAKGRMNGIVIVCHDITERKQAGELIRASELKYRDIFTWSPVGIFQSTLTGDIRTANASLATILGYDSTDDLLTLSMQRDIYADTREGEMHFSGHQNNSGREVTTSEHQWRKKNGELVWISVTCHIVNDENGSALYHEGFVHDISGRKVLEEQIRQAQKLESLGTLASGIAHDFNNILGIILGHASLLDQLSTNSPGIHSSVEAVLKATQRGAALVRQLLTFARKTETFVESVFINDIIQELAKLINETFPKAITVVTTLASGIPSIRGDATQLHQVLLNLSVNARDAMPKGGALTFSTALVPLETVRTKFPRAEAAEYILITVSDTGVGMDEKTRRRIFEPFFTTKEPGKGTGLGMAVVYGVVESHHGFINVESEVGRGTTFTIAFPVETGLVVERSEHAYEEEPPGGTETLLIIEDEEMLRGILQEALVQKGYRVHTAADGEEAVKMYSQHQREIALVISDVGLPKMTGDKIFYLIKEITPAVKFILASGFIEPDLKSELIGAGVQEFVQKPYRQSEILAKIRAVIDRKMS
ncbi:MAG: PAS domain S-box protein [Bacteroidota bacterium]|nr:PAS domain S-box protein [Bacteroidota bacterium]